MTDLHVQTYGSGEPALLVHWPTDTGDVASLLTALGCAGLGRGNCSRTLRVNRS